MNADWPARRVPPPTPADVDATAHVFLDDLAERRDISGPEGHHLQRVRRLRAGERVTAADGSGAWREYTVTKVAPGHVVVDACGPLQHEATPAVTIGCAVALTKGGLDEVVARLTELGVASVTLVRTARTVVRWDDSKAGHAVARLRTVAREAAMQSRRARVPRVDDVADLEALARERAHLVVADRTGSPGFLLVPPDRGEWTLLVGPEGGFDESEHARLSDRPRCSLGNYVLRAGTAPLAGVAILQDRIAQMGRA
jgi:16S rRNA (uracil1498-N3)-methyltransferase